MARDEVSAVTENAICLHRLAVCDVNFENVTYSQLGPFRYDHKGADVKPTFVRAAVSSYAPAESLLG